jgi:hypothetical protein
MFQIQENFISKAQKTYYMVAQQKTEKIEF